MSTIAKEKDKCELISWIPFEGIYEMELYKIKFPLEIYNAFWDKAKSENEEKQGFMKLKELHACMKLDLTDIYYTNFVSKDNLEDGWIFSSTDENLSTIKIRLKRWIDYLGLEGLNDVIKNINFEKETIIITKEDLINKNYKSKVFLSHIAKYIAENMTITLGENDINNLNFTFVNNSENFRIIGLTDNNLIKVGEEEFLYGYYVDFKIQDLMSTNKVFINMIPGQLRFAKKEVKTVFKKGLNPYILINNKSAIGSSKVTAITGAINYVITKDNEHQYRWDSSLKYMNEVIFEALPNEYELLNNPSKFINYNDNLSILIPYGTHITSSSVTDVASGMDLFLREEILDKIYTLVSTKYNVFKERPITETKKGFPKIDFKQEVLPINSTFNIDVLYLNEYTKLNMKKFEDNFNDLEQTLNKINSKSYVDIEEEVRINNVKLLYKSLYPNILENKCCSKIKFNFIDYSHTSAISTPKNRGTEEFMEEFLELDIDSSANVSIVEYNEPKYFLYNQYKDLFKEIRYANAEFFTKATQFMHPIEEVDVSELNSKKQKKYYDEIYGKIVKCILECLRLTGIVSAKDFHLMDCNIGVTVQKGYLIFTAINGNDIYGKIDNSKWMSYSEFTVELAKLNDDGKCKGFENNKLLIENSIEEFLKENNIKNATLNIHYNTLKNYIPFIKSGFNNDFNLKIDKEDKENKYLPYTNEGLSVLIIDDACQVEWVSVKNGKRETTSFPYIFTELEDKLVLSVSDMQSVMQKPIKTNAKTRKETNENSVKFNIYSKNKPCLIYCAKVGKERNSYSLLINAHQLKRNTSIQHFKNESTECTKLPLPLHLALISVDAI